MQTGLRLKNLKYFKGLRNFEENNSVPPDQIYDCTNVRFDSYVISSKQGHQALGDQLTGGTKFKALFNYPYFSSGTETEKLIGMYNKTFYEYDQSSNTWGAIATTWADVADEETEGLLYNNVAYFVNPMDDSAAPTTYTSAYLTGGVDATSLAATWEVVTDGSFNITIDGTLRTVSGIDFTGVETMDEVATVIQTALRAATGSTETVTWELDHFTIGSANTTSTSAITEASAAGVGTDISGVGATNFMDAETGVGTITAAVGIYPGIGKIVDSTFSVVPNSPRGTAVESWVERIWIIGDESAPNAVFASRPASAANPEYVEDWVTNPILELIGKGGRCVAIRVLNNELFVWKQDSIWYNTTDRIAAGETPFIELSRTGGAINQKSTILVENDVWFLSKTGKGIEVRSLGLERSLGQNPRTRELSNIIKRSMNLLDPDQSNAVMSYVDQEVKISLRTKGSPTNNFNIIFDYDTAGYSIDIGQSIDRAVIWNGDLVYTEDSSAGQAYKDNNGYTAAGAAFVFDFKTPFIDDVRPDISKRARYIYVRGQQSYDQEITIRLFMNGDYTNYSEYVIPSPRDRGVALTATTAGGQPGASQQGADQWGGDAEDSDDIPMYRIQDATCGDYLISIDRRCNMFALGGHAQINGGKVIIEQLGLKLIDDNENYKRANL